MVSGAALAAPAVRVFRSEAVSVDGTGAGGNRGPRSLAVSSVRHSDVSGPFNPDDAMLRKRSCSVFQEERLEMLGLYRYKLPCWIEERLEMPTARPS